MRSLPPILPAQFEEFLHSIVPGSEDSPPLTVLSVLARMEVDPWEEADRLSKIPLPQAEAALASALRLAGCMSGKLDYVAIASNLMGVLRVGIQPRNRLVYPVPARGQQNSIFWHVVWYLIVLSFLAPAGNLTNKDGVSMPAHENILALGPDVVTKSDEAQAPTTSPNSR